MSIRDAINKIPGANKAYQNIMLRKEYAYDRKFFYKNYSRSSESKNKIGYNCLLICHALEKGMSNKNPRRFGRAKIEDLIKLLEKYESYNDYKEDFAYVNSVSALREYAAFYEKKNWTDADEYSYVKQFLESRKGIKNVDTGSYVLKKIDFEKDSKINYKKFLASRHSIREFASRRIGGGDIKRAIEAAILSPSACNRQMCKVYYSTDKKIVEKIIKIGQGFSAFNKETINPLVVTFDINANSFVGERNQGWFNAGLFSMNLVNALHSQGIGSCFIQFGNKSFEEEELKKILNIPPSERVAVIIAAGYYCDENTVLRSPRKSIEDIYRER